MAAGLFMASEDDGKAESRPRPPSSTCHGEFESCARVPSPGPADYAAPAAGGRGNFSLPLEATGTVLCTPRVPAVSWVYLTAQYVASERVIRRLCEAQTSTTAAAAPHTNCSICFRPGGGIISSVTIPGLLLACTTLPCCYVQLCVRAGIQCHVVI